jgi:hypothetical protein
MKWMDEGDGEKESPK